MTRVEAAAGQWSQPGGRRCSRPAQPEARRRFFGHAVRWLRFAGLLEEPRAKRHAHAGEVAVFAAWMRRERGWSEDTIRGCLHTVDRLFGRLEGRGVALASVRIADIDREIASYRARACSRVTIHDFAQRLRASFRFAERRGWCAQGLAEGIMPSRFYPGETIPKGLERDEVVRLLAATRGERPADVRDRAVLMFLITYGLRSGEVAGLRLEDLDWEEETLRVRRPKPGTHAPLSALPRRRRGGRALYPRDPSRAPRTDAVPHAERSDPAAEPKRGIACGQEPPRATRHHRQAPRSACAAPRGGAASPRPWPVDEGGRRLSRTSQRLGALREVAGVDLEGLA